MVSVVGTGGPHPQRKARRAHLPKEVGGLWGVLNESGLKQSSGNRKKKEGDDTVAEKQ